MGQALRTINRQSSDLLEIAETVSSLKLQQEASPAELSAVGQLVMLTQRIGKSANEFLTMEGVSPEAVFLLGKDLNSFREIAQGLVDGNQELRLPGTKDPQTKERLVALLKQYEETRTQASAILGNLQGLVSAREAQASIIADSEPLRKGLEAVQDGLVQADRFRRGQPAGADCLRGHHDPAAASASCACTCVTRPCVRSSPKASDSKPNARNRKPSASTTPTRRPFCD